MPKKSSTTKILYHKRTPRLDCPDGIAAAWVANLSTFDAQVIGCIYQTEPPKINPSDRLIIVDFSFPIETLNHWRNIGCEITLIDHHKTLADHVQEAALSTLRRSLINAIAESTQLHEVAIDLNLTTVEVSKLKALLGDRTSAAYRRYPNLLQDFLETASLKREGAIALADYISDRSVGELFRSVSGGVLSFDMRKCGAVLAWEYFFPDQPVPAFLYYVQDRDLFNHVLPSTEEIHEVFGYLGRTFDVFDHLSGLSQEQLVDQYQDLGRMLLAPKRKKIEAIAAKAKWQPVLGHGVLTVELSNLEAGLASDVCAYIYNHHPETPFVVAYSWVEKEQRYKLSFRCTKERSLLLGMDKVAGTWGGGGHAPAAGASMEILPWMV